MGVICLKIRRSKTKDAPRGGEFGYVLYEYIGEYFRCCEVKDFEAEKLCNLSRASGKEIKCNRARCFVLFPYKEI